MLALLLAIAAAAPPDADAFVAVSPADDRPAGKLVRLTRGFTATLATRTGETTVPGVLSLRRPDRPLPPFPTGPHLVTTAGDRIAGTLLGGDGESLRFLPSAVRLKTEQAWKVPLPSAAVVWLADTPADTPPDPARYDWLAGVQNRDVLRFRNGDTAKGTLDGLDPEAAGAAFAFRPEQGAARTVAGSEVAAVAFNSDLARARKPKGPYARVVLTDGSRLALTNATIADARLTGEALFGQKVELPLAVVAGLDVLQGKAAYLSDLKPKKVEQAGFLGVAWPWAADRTVHGTALRVTTAGGESTHDKGLGTHPRTVLSYDLGGKYGRFEALVEIDPGTAVRARAAVRVLVDGKEQGVPGLANLTAGNAVAVRIDVRGAKELLLVTDFGPAGGVGADVNWADARLVE
jgi:NPCBM/NEW2 domain